MKIFFIESSYGIFTVNIETGKVIKKELQTPQEDDKKYLEHLDSIINFDLVEFKIYYSRSEWSLKENSTYDILDFGHTYISEGQERYWNPDADYRK